jgi:hypothetical protein
MIALGVAPEYTEVMSIREQDAREKLFRTKAEPFDPSCANVGTLRIGVLV